MKKKILSIMSLIVMGFCFNGAAVAAKKTHPQAYETIIEEMAHKHQVPVALAHAVIRVESNYNPKAKGRAGEIGLMQIKPKTARWLGFSGSTAALYNPRTNLEYGLRYLSRAYQLGGGNICKTILKYNAGHGAKRMNRTSARYCSRVKNYMKAA